MLEAIRTMFQSRSDRQREARAELQRSERAVSEARRRCATEPDNEGAWQALAAAEEAQRRARIVAEGAPREPALEEKAKRLTLLVEGLSSEAFAKELEPELAAIEAAEAQITEARRGIEAKLVSLRQREWEARVLARTLGVGDAVPMAPTMGNAIGMSTRRIAKVKRTRGERVGDDGSRFISPAWSEVD